MKEKYITPDMEIVIFSSEDIITTSVPDIDSETGLPIKK